MTSTEDVSSETKGSREQNGWRHITVQRDVMMVSQFKDGGPGLYPPSHPGWQQGADEGFQPLQSHAFGNGAV